MWRRSGTNKMNARRTRSPLTGHWYASQFECTVGDALELLQRAGRIQALERQQREHLCCGVRWAIDFRYIDPETGTRRWAEAKGLEDREYRIKRKLWAAFGLGPLDVYRAIGRGFAVTETIVPDASKLLRDDWIEQIRGAA